MYFKHHLILILLRIEKTIFFRKVKMLNDILSNMYIILTKLFVHHCKKVEQHEEKKNHLNF